MFSADLSWTDENAELVGERKERKARQRAGSICSSSSSFTAPRRAGTVKTSSTASSLQSIKGSLRRPTSSSKARRKAASLAPTDPHAEYCDPPQQSDWTLAATLAPSLQSDPPPLDEYAPANPYAMDGRLNVTRSPPLPLGHRAWAIATKAEADALVRSYEQVKETILTIQARQAGAFWSNRSNYTVNESGVQEQEPQELPVQGHEYERGPNGSLDPPPRSPLQPSPRDQERPDYYLTPTPVEELPKELPAILQTVTVTVSEERLDEASIIQELDVPPPPRPKSPVPSPRTPPPPISKSRTPPPPNESIWQAPDSWDYMPKDDIPDDSTTSSSPEPPLDPAGDAYATHFQRFVDRIEAVGPKIILSRLKEEWRDNVDEAAKGELALERHLSALTALQMKGFDKFATSRSCATIPMLLPPLSLSRRRKILEMDGNVGEVYQLAAIYPDSKIYHLTRPNAARSIIALPAQASQHPLPGTRPSNADPNSYPFFPLPYTTASMHHIRCSRLATLLPAAQLPALIAECHRVLKPGGFLELRLMDAMPARSTMGPKMAAWLEERLLIKLDAGFRCSRPLTLVPRWVKDAGFQPLPFTSEAEAHGRLSANSHISSAMATQPRGRNRSPANNSNGLTRCLRLPTIAVEAPLSPNRAGESGRDLVNSQVGVLVARALWKDTWGASVMDEEREGGSSAKWWWEEPKLARECMEWKTSWDVGTLIVAKEG